MNPDTPAPLPDHERLRPGPVAWLVILGGFAVMAWALIGVFDEAGRTNPASWFTWVIGAALVHDLIVLPLVLLAGIGLASAVREVWLRRFLRWALAVCAVLALASIPVVGRFGARPDNPSVLPLPAGRNLAVVCAALLVVAVAAGLAMDWWFGREPAPADRPSDPKAES